MYPDLEYDASWAFFGNQIMMPLACDILKFGGDEFVPSHIGRRGSHIQGAMTRLVKLGYLAVVPGHSLTRYHQVPSAFEELVMIFSSALLDAKANRPHVLTPLDPPLESFGTDSFGWQSQIDKTAARTLCGGVARIALLLQLYNLGTQEFYIHRNFGHAYYRQLRQAMLIENAPRRSTTEWHFERRTSSPFWQLIPVLWQYLLDNHPHPVPSLTLRIDMMYRRPPLVTPVEATIPSYAQSFL